MNKAVVGETLDNMRTHLISELVTNEEVGLVRNILQLILHSMKAEFSMKNLWLLKG